ncbi:hypothetical protein HPP92_028131 [Vanilla planifolia]|uniref:Uncharacterized protein n=1 Tax=Vanilla planifolia TaxID=51239 RepID=A0A835P769_VANPL|nr:hypothetical protein HPP92_028131 [Vanilla planifolia]
MLGSLYDTLQALSEKEMERNCAVSAETIDVRPEVEDSFATIANEFCYSVPVDDIIKKIKAYFENDRITQIRGSSFLQHASILLVRISTNMLEILLIGTKRVVTLVVYYFPRVC